MISELWSTTEHDFLLQNALLFYRLRCPDEGEKIKINWPVIYENAEMCSLNPLNRPDAHKGIAELQVT